MLKARVINKLGGFVRTFTVTTSFRKNEESKDRMNPINRTFKVISDDLKRVKEDVKAGFRNDGKVTQEEQFQTHCDILVVGGGGVGSSIAYFLKEKAREGLNVVVVERDPTYKNCSTSLSVGGLRQQFSLPENIQMSLFAADFMREINDYLGDVQLDFQPHGYLMLASEAGAETLKSNSNLQKQLGARNELLTPERLRAKFPWICTDGIALGCHGLEKEGWFDPWALLMGFRNKAKELGAHFIHGTVEQFDFENRDDVFIQGDVNAEFGYNSVNHVQIKMPNGEMRTIKFAICVVAAGAASGDIGRLLNMGRGQGILRVPLPVEPRKRYVYVVSSQGMNAPGLNSPLTVDPNGTYFRRDGLCGNYICGRSPNIDAEPSVDNLDVDHEFFDENIWPTLAHRVKAFESAKVNASWAGFYEHNIFDRNGIIGPHPYYNNVYIATGFSGHGIQQTPAVGRAISELIIDGQFRTIDLTRLGFDRIIVDRPMYEANIV